MCRSKPEGGRRCNGNGSRGAAAPVSAGWARGGGLTQQEGMLTRAKSDWTYCNCAGRHKDGCPNNKPDGLPPLNDDDD